jgi:putative membrane protein
MKRIAVRMFAGALAFSALTHVAGAQNSAGVMSGSMPMLAPSESKFLRGFNDSEILGHLMLADSAEVSIAQAALRRSKSDAVLAYAKQMASDHASAKNATRQIAKQADITPVAIVNEMKMSHMGASVDSVDIASDLTVDRHYIMSQVEMHQHMLAELETFRGVARNPALRAHIDAEIPAVREHLAKAHEIARSKGFEKKA